MERVFITGANRGIGLAMVQEYLQANALVIATCRNPQEAHELQALGAQYPQALHILALDVTDDEAIQGLDAQTSAWVDGLDLLINNAGINGEKDDGTRSLGNLRRDALLNMTNVNAVSGVLVTQALTRLLKKGKNPRVVMVSSQMGSLEYAKNTTNFGYTMSKVAMNMGARVLANDLKPHGIISITTHPGWVQTSMGGDSAPLTPSQSAKGLRTVFDSLTLDDTGKFYKWDGTIHAW